MNRKQTFTNAKRGPVVPVPKGSTRVTICIDDQILDWLREQVDSAGGGDYQTFITAALREFIARRQA